MGKTKKSTEITANFYYKKNGESIEKILWDSILAYIKKEVNQVCASPLSG
jgi:hypothetical protein